MYYSIYGGNCLAFEGKQSYFVAVPRVSSAFGMATENNISNIRAFPKLVIDWGHASGSRKKFLYKLFIKSV